MTTPFKIFFVSTLLLAGCATAPSGDRKPASESAENHSLPDGLWQSGAIEISYIMGHDLHRLVIEAKEGNVRARELHDKETLKDTSMESSVFFKLWGKVQSFVDAAQRKPAADSTCRYPFAITVRSGINQKTRNGCRQGDEGVAMAKIARETEFLMYSKK